ncbi:hypothetical protein IFM89_035084 [Coptis chinensis]|uniref:Two-component response regulator n=1 Tax=Coptis chinensis TaxID=261450 RepID=A0A835IIR9_9MAGN|nr:hypothetical protein IFM89_035084 [Coptis chinensis]
MSSPIIADDKEVIEILSGGSTTTVTSRSNTTFDPSESNTIYNPSGLRVLLVDDDILTLKVIERMLNICKYEAIAVSRPTDALNILYEKQGGFDLVVTDVHMPIMNGFELLDIVRKEYKIPVIMISADDKSDVIYKGLQHGACSFFVKPLAVGVLQNMWQYVLITNQTIERPRSLEAEQSFHPETSIHVKKVREGVECSSSVNHEKERQKDLKRKKMEDTTTINTENSDKSLEPPKKSRMVWTPVLHEKFVEAINSLGLYKAVPKKILDMMNVRGVSRTNIASHLQKYRQYLKTEKNPSQSRGNFRNISSFTNRAPSTGYAPCRDSSVFYNAREGPTQERQHNLLIPSRPGYSVNVHGIGLNALLDNPEIGTPQYHQAAAKKNHMDQARCGQSISRCNKLILQQPWMSSSSNVDKLNIGGYHTFGRDGPLQVNNDLNQPHAGSYRTFVVNAPLQGPNNLCQLNAGSYRTFGMNVPLQGDNESNQLNAGSYRTFGRNVPSQGDNAYSCGNFGTQMNAGVFPNVPVDQQDFSNANLEAQNNPASFGYYGLGHQAPGPCQVANINSSYKSNFVGLQLLNNGEMIRLGQTETNANDISNTDMNMNRMEGIHYGKRPMEAVDENSPIPNYDAINYNNAAQVGSSSDDFVNPNTFQVMHAAEIQPNHRLEGGESDGWVDLLRDPPSNDLREFLCSEDNTSRKACHILQT